MLKNYEKDISLRINDSDINQALKSLIMTPLGSVPFRPDFGSEITDILFELMSTINASRLGAAIEMAVNNYEPRIKLTSLYVLQDGDNNRYDVYINYNIIYDLTEPYTFYLPLTVNSSN